MLSVTALLTASPICKTLSLEPEEFGMTITQLWRKHWSMMIVCSALLANFVLPEVKPPSEEEIAAICKSKPSYCEHGQLIQAAILSQEPKARITAPPVQN